MAHIITATIPRAELDIRALRATDGWKPLGDDLSFEVSEFLVSELSMVGGKAIVEVDDENLNCLWYPPDPADSDVNRVLYVSHMLQAGLMVDPSRVIAHTAYLGHGADLAIALLGMHSSGLNTYVAGRDLALLAYAAPMFGMIWLTLGFVLLSDENITQAYGVFDHLAEIEPENIMGAKYLAIIQSIYDPLQAVKQAEKVFRMLAAAGVAPDHHARLTYGFALRAAGLDKEARQQFELACGVDPKMTVEEWVSGGCLLPPMVLMDTLKKV